MHDAQVWIIHPVANYIATTFNYLQLGLFHQHDHLCVWHHRYNLLVYFHLQDQLMLYVCVLVDISDVTITSRM